MGQYSIKELEKLSGIKAHTIRIWEKRHGIVQPQRTSTNIRLYSDEDLKRIINVSLLNHNGLKISRIARMSNEEINQKIAELSRQKTDAELFIDQLVVSMVDLDEWKFNEVITQLEERIGFIRTITEVVYPFLEKIGVMWQTGTITPAHEHFISNLIRQKFITAIASLPIAPRSAPSALLFLPEGELHEFGLLFFHYITRKKGYYTFYLGQSVPLADVLTIYDTHQPKVVISNFISQPAPSQLQSYLNRLAGHMLQAQIYAAGHNLRNAAVLIPKNVKVIYRAVEFEQMLPTIKEFV
ncbi:MAG: MerR family transcriptional regulator [Cyclobacteriaceae bacterium]|nr:MerR family transcriptional regulator [Cyclobacteriaceae bacterium]MCX7638249.1 MerR family transcriptional regulator [Cyclobacteriaceae bacterium]MDW8332239.1 MerR family transcriptional regulator [Cyclobacteriaceae bacterium]